MPLQDIGEISLYYEISGSGPKLVLIGGYSCNIRFWNPIRNLLEKDFQLLIFDNRGAGRSDIPKYPYSINQMAEDAMALMKKLHFTPSHILGASLGGAIVQYLARTYPKQWPKIILSNTFIELKPKTKLLVKNFLKLSKIAPLPLLYEAVIPWLFSDRFIQNSENVQSYVDRQVHDPHPQSLMGLKNQAQALLSFSSRSWYEKITCPSLIIHGEQDIYCPMDDAFALAEGMPNAVLHTFPHAGHLTHVEDPERFAEAITKFILEA